MIAFDTNVLVRLLVRDDREQFAAAASLLEAAKGARTTYTFDGKLKNREGFTYLR